ncbi:uncharacterized protein LOC143034639 [Oratosquilla oratoria]|uniref:uncharacterized protein LOC143034639 n=1 Tax=Oratosquilla oratoria TaxID=337810 RepID=UPI003F774D71
MRHALVNECVRHMTSYERLQDPEERRPKDDEEKVVVPQKEEEDFNAKKSPKEREEMGNSRCVPDVVNSVSSSDTFLSRTKKTDKQCADTKPQQSSSVNKKATKRRFVWKLRIVFDLKWKRMAKEDKVILVEEYEEEDTDQPDLNEKRQRLQGKRRKIRQKNFQRAGRRLRKTLGRACRYMGVSLANMTTLVPAAFYATDLGYVSDFRNERDYSFVYPNYPL